MRRVRKKTESAPRKGPATAFVEARGYSWIPQILDMHRVERQGLIYNAHSMPADPLTVADEIYHDREAPIYDDYSTEDRVRLVERWLVPALIDFAGAGVIADLGCGTGRIAVDLLNLGRIVVAVDHSKAMLMKLLEKEQGHKLVAVRADARCLPILDNACDGVICSGVLHHISDWEKVLVEAARVLKPGGRLVVREPNADYAANLFKPIEYGLAWAAQRICRVDASERASPRAWELVPYEAHL